MSSPKYAPAREDGLKPYLVTTTEWGKDSHDIEWAASLSDAKREFGYTMMRYTRVTVRRATPDDVEAHA